MKKAASYVRFSSDHQREESTEAQLSDNKKYAMKNNIMIIQEYVDRAESGTTDNREQFQQMIHDAKKGNFDTIIVHKVDRFARNRYDSAMYKHTLNLTTEVMKGLKENAKKAKFNGGTPPLGFDIDKDNFYIINEKEAPIVKEIFDLYLDGNGYKSIAKTLNEKGYRTKKGSKFVFNSIPSIIKNKKYCGIYEFNKTSRSYGEDGKRNLKKYKPKDKIIVIEDAIPKIISKETFLKAEKEFNIRSKKRGVSIAHRDYFLSGLITCTSCNRSVTGYSQRRFKGSEPYFYYRCSGCNNSIRCEELENRVLKEVSNVIFSDIDSLLEQMQSYIAKTIKETPAELKYLESELKKTNNEIDSIVDIIVKGIGSIELGRKLETLEEYRETIEDRIVDLGIKVSIPEKEITDWLLELEKDFNNKNNLKKILKSIIKDIKLSKDGYEIDYFIQMPNFDVSSLSDVHSAPCKKE